MEGITLVVDHKGRHNMSYEIQDLESPSVKHEACTIFCRVSEYETIYRLINQKLPNIQLDGNSNLWRKIHVSSSKCEMVLSSLVQIQPGDRFSKIILGSLCYFENIKTNALRNQDHVLDLLTYCEMIIGVVSIPEFVDEDDTSEVIFGICEKTNGLIFDGDGMIDSNGKLVLGGRGEYDYLI